MKCSNMFMTMAYRLSQISIFKYNFGDSYDIHGMRLFIFPTETMEMIKIHFGY